MVAHCKDRCKVWEVENEPNFYFSPQTYMETRVIPFYKGAKAADPDCTVMGPGGCGVRDTLNFMEYVYSAKLNGYFDNISTHTYPGPGESWEQFGNLAMIGLLKDWMKANGDAGKRLWQTEQGYTWDGPPKGQTARYAVRQFLQGWRLGIEPSYDIYFYPQSHGFESWYQSGGGEAGSVDFVAAGGGRTAVLRREHVRQAVRRRRGFALQGHLPAAVRWAERRRSGRLDLRFPLHAGSEGCWISRGWWTTWAIP